MSEQERKIFVEEFEFQSDQDGTRIQGFIWPAAAPVSVMVIAHGAAEHSLRYERFAEALNSARVTVWSIDHRGHGRSPGPEGLGDFGAAGWDGLVADIGQAVTLARAANPGLPLTLFGHSMGAGAAQQFAPDGSGTIDALILSGSTLREPPKEGEAPSAVQGANAAFEPSRTPYDWLSRDEAEVDKYIADPLCGFEGRASNRGGTRNPFLNSDPDRIKAIRNDLPVLLVAGDADPINQGLKGLHYLEEKWREGGVEKIDRLFYEGGRHEMLNEINRDDVMADIIQWLSEVHAA